MYRQRSRNNLALYLNLNIMNKPTSYALIIALIFGVLVSSPAMARENEKNSHSNKPVVAEIKHVNQSIKKTEKIVNQSIKKLDKIIDHRTTSSTPANVLAYRAAVKQAQLNYQNGLKALKATYEQALRDAKAQFHGTTTTTNLMPTVSSNATSTPSPVIGTTTALSVLGADDGGEANLRYTWSTDSGPAVVSFSSNGLNASKNTTATFSKAGSYVLRVTITDLGGLSVATTVGVTVSQTISAVTISPTTTTLHVSSSTLFSASALDQFFNTMATLPTFNWVATGGTIGATGVTSTYSASTASGTFYAAVSGGGFSATSSIQVTP